MYPITYLKIIKKICNKHSINIQSFQDETILRLSKNNEVHFIWSRRFELNSSIASRIADNKFATYTVLNAFNIPVVKCIKLPRIDTEEYKNLKKGCFELCHEMFNKYSSIVLKPNNSFEGTDVYKCSCIKEFEQIYQLINNKYKYLVISPYINANAEYRVIYLNGKTLFVYQKEKPYIKTDGKSTVLELLINNGCNITQVDQAMLEDIYKIHPNNNKLQINWKFNLTQGANCIPVNDRILLSKIYELAYNAAKAINISFASIDILKDEQGQLQVLEINAGVAMDQFIQKYPDGENIAFSIYEKALLAMFNEQNNL